VIASVAGSLILDPKKITIKKGLDNRTQLLFTDVLYISLFADTTELLEYLENITEQVRMIHCEQSPKDLR